MLDGCNIAFYICEWSLFAVYYSDVFAWSSTLTGAAQMAGDLLAAAILALTTTTLWARLLSRGERATRCVDRVLLQPPFNIALFFTLYGVCFLMLSQPTFALSVLGQVAMGTVYVFNKQAVQETYVVLSHGSLPLFRVLEFGGSVSFNLAMASSSIASVLAYEHLSPTAPFLIVAAVSTAWALVVVVYFGLRLRGRVADGFATAEKALLLERQGTGNAVRRNDV